MIKNKIRFFFDISLSSHNGTSFYQKMLRITYTTMFTAPKR